MKSMKSMVFALFIVIVSAHLGHTAEYRVKGGDSLKSISKWSGHSVKQLARINYLDDWDLIQIGQIIRFISTEDVIMAKLWVQKQIIETNPYNFNRHSMLEYQLQALENKDFLYSHFAVLSPSGIMVWDVLNFADNWRKFISPKIDFQATTTRKKEKRKLIETTKNNTLEVEKLKKAILEIPGIDRQNVEKTLSQLNDPNLLRVIYVSMKTQSVIQNGDFKLIPVDPTKIQKRRP